MNDGLIGLLAGIFIGTFLGIFIMSLCAISAMNERR